MKNLYIKCRACNYENAQITLEEKRYKVNCLRCGEQYLLKEQWNFCSNNDKK